MMLRTRILVLGTAMVLCSADPAAGLQRTIQARWTSYDATPVSVRRASLELIQTYTMPNQFPLAVLPDGQDTRVPRSRVRYLNLINQQLPTYALEGEIELRNHSSKAVAALQLTAVFLNPFRERIGIERQSVVTALGPNETKRLTWSRSLPNPEVFEVVFVVSAIRFLDGQVWSPTEELLLAP